MTYTNDYPVSWEDIHVTAKALAVKLKDKGPFKGIVAVARGGLIPASQVAYELDIHLIETISVTSYDHKSQSEAKIASAPQHAGDGEGWLVIDELSDTGNTFRAIRNILPKATYACLYAKPKGTETVDVYVTDVLQDSWIYLPWDDLNFPAHIFEKIGKHLKQ
ncbi:MAG: xanthine phosphoribosyltransferase [Micavibrio aeruginosavorus]|uniref:Xanthine phosphoribosyltransferase n=1 Tax=Micavibrio aeruginosavorus TaxID=349221 RepID=A0A2W5FGE4_9BACT|nr:MAG: xanthine phosphoribosyltransferase [Micavibrio aeruginosavorus]